MNNYRLILAFCATALFLSIGTSAWAQCSDCDASANAGEYATIAQPICIEKNTDLRFGGILAGTVSGTCTVNAAGTRTFQTGTGKPKGYSQITFGPAQFTVTGEPNLYYCISWYADPNNLSRVGGGGTAMSCDLTAPSGGNSMNGTGTVSKLNSSGTDTWKMGGVLTVGANQTSGQYSGQFTAAVYYQ
jgi:hypothetical protein